MKQEFEGKVTHLNTYFHYIVLDNIKKIYLSLLDSETPFERLIYYPKLQDTIKISSKTQQLGYTWVVQNKTEIHGNLESWSVASEFIQFLRWNKLKVCHIFNVDQWICTLNKFFPKLKDSVAEEIILSLLKKYFKCICDNFPNNYIKVDTVSSLRFVDIEKTYVDFPFWSYGIHRKQYELNYIFGYLEINAIYGYMTISDHKYHFVCGYTNKQKRDLAEIIGSYVLIKDYIIITEIFSEPNVKNSEFLFFDLQNVDRINFLEAFPTLFPAPAPPEIQYEHNMTFTVLRKSNAHFSSYSKENLTKFFLEIFIIEKNAAEVSKNAYFCLHQEFASRMPGIEENMTYKLFYNNPLKKIYPGELRKIGKWETYDLTDTTVYIQKLDFPQRISERTLTVEEAREQVALNYTDFINFEGVISKKSFAHNISNFKCVGAPFGTNSSKTHQLVFCYMSGYEKFLDCYLNDWQHILMPFGLIPDMRVKVKNVLAQSRKYLKATIFTTFELIDYEPKMPFNTVSLFSDTGQWGPGYYFSKGKDIPEGVLMWCSVEKVEIIQLKIHHTCKCCKEEVVSPVETVTECGKCKGKDRELEFYLKMNVTDELGCSQLFGTNVELLKTIFQLQNWEYDKLLQALKIINNFKYDYFNRENKTFTELREDSILKKMMIENLEALNDVAICSMDFMARNKSKDQNKPVKRYQKQCPHNKEVLNIRFLFKVGKIHREYIETKMQVAPIIQKRVYTEMLNRIQGVCPVCTLPLYSFRNSFFQFQDIQNSEALYLPVFSSSLLQMSALKPTALLFGLFELVVCLEKNKTPTGSQELSIVQQKWEWLQPFSCMLKS